MLDGHSSCCMRLSKRPGDMLGHMVDLRPDMQTGRRRLSPTNAAANYVLDARGVRRVEHLKLRNVDGRASRNGQVRAALPSDARQAFEGSELVRTLLR